MTGVPSVWEVIIYGHYCPNSHEDLTIYVGTHEKFTKIKISKNEIASSHHFLAPAAERQRSFSNADSSVVRPSSVRHPSVINFSIKSLISQKLSDNFFSFLACSFLRMVPMHSKNMNVVESS